MKQIILILIVITSTLQKGCLSAPEPLCSKFSYDEQLLEKMIRMELNVNNMEKSMQTAEEKILERQKNIEDTLEKFENKIKLLEEKEAAFINTVNNTLQRNWFATSADHDEPACLRELVATSADYDEHARERDNTVIAFHAQEVADKSLATDQVIVFTKANLNEGDSYDNTNGYFTASVSGIYHFTAHLCGRLGKYVEYALRVNDTKWTRGHYNAKDMGTCTSFSVTVKMKAGERAWVTIDDKGSSSTDILFEDSDDWNYFTGFLVRRMD